MEVETPMEVSPKHEAKKTHEYPCLRPDPPYLDPSTTDFEFFQVESEYRVTEQGVVIYQYGDTLEGNSVTVRVTGFDPHFSIRAPEPGCWEFYHYEFFRTELEAALRRKVSWKEAKMFTHLVKNIEPYRGYELYGYHGEEPQTFLKITLASPTFVRDCRLLLEYPHGKPKTEFISEIEDWWPGELPAPVVDPYKDKAKHSGYPRYFYIYEANLKFTLRYEVDHKIRATGWVKIQKGKYGISYRDSPGGNPSATSQIEIWCDHSAVGPSSRTSKMMPPLCVISIDSECETAPNGGFPKAVYYTKGENGKPVPTPGSGERMLQMGFKKIFGNKTSQGVHLIESCTDVKEADEIYCYPDEQSFLRGFKQDVKTLDPTFWVDFNGANFDRPYLIDRLKQTGVYDYFGDFGRLRGVLSQYRSSTFSTAAHKTEKFTNNNNGRVQLDLMQCLKRDKKLRSYGLNAVANKFLGRSKVEMDYHMINEHQQTPEGRANLAYYCMYDGILPLDIIEKLKMIVNYVQMAHVAGVSVEELLNNGQQLRMLAQVYHYSKDTVTNPNPNGIQEKHAYPYVVPVHPTYLKFSSDKYQITDPSIIIAHNLCWITHVTAEQIEKWGLLEGVQYKRVPDHIENPDGSVSQASNPANPCFLLTEEASFKNMVSLMGLKEGIHYKTIPKTQKTPAISKLIANEETRRILQQHGIIEKVHYDVTKDPRFEEPIIHIRAVKKGIIPALLEGLLAKRKEVRGEAANETDKQILAIIDALQNSYKTMANSMYGATGVGEKGYLPLREVAETVTRYGRGYIIFTKWKVETKFCKKNGYPFNANVIYGDTDSVFVRHEDSQSPFYRPENPWVYELCDSSGKHIRTITSDYDFDLVRNYGQEMAKYVTDEIGTSPMSLAYEKSFNGILLISKKRYAGDKIVWGWDSAAKKPIIDPTQSKFSATGLECVRRDSCILVEEMVGDVLKKIIIERDVLGAVEYTRSEIAKLLQGKTRYSKLIITRSLSRKPSDYKAKSAHVSLAERIEKRDPGNAYKLGDRVKYVVIPGSKKQKNFELGEDPLYAFENGIPPNYSWYLSNQLKKPLQRIFYYVFKNKQVLEKIKASDKDAEWIKKYDFYMPEMKEEDLFDTDEMDEEREEKDEEMRDMYDADDLERETTVPDVAETVQKQTPRMATQTNTKRKANTLADYLGVSSFKEPKIEGRETKKPATKKEKDKEHQRDRKKQEQKMEASPCNSILFSGKHTRTIVKPMPNMGTGVLKFCTALPNCQVCGMPAESEQKGLCNSCDFKDMDTIIAAKEKANARLEKSQTEAARCLGICKECVKSNPSIDYEKCRNVDCDNLWDRLMATRDLTKEQRIQSLEW